MEWPKYETVMMPLVEQLGLLSGTLGTVSGDLEKFMDYMKVTMNDEISLVFEAMSSFQEDTKACQSMLLSIF